MDATEGTLPSSPGLFWDVDPAGLDIQRHSRFIIERVLQFGRPEDVRWLLATYDRESIGRTLRFSRRLDRRTGTYWAIHFAIPRDEVVCLRQP